MLLFTEKKTEEKISLPKGNDQLIKDQNEILQFPTFIFVSRIVT